MTSCDFAIGAQLLPKMLFQCIHVGISFLNACWLFIMKYLHCNDRHVNLGFHIVMCVRELIFGFLPLYVMPLTTCVCES